MPKNPTELAGGQGAADAAGAPGGRSSRQTKWKVLAVVRRLDDTTGEWSKLKLQFAGSELCLLRQRKKGAWSVEERVPFAEITHMLFGTKMFERIFADYPLRREECDPWSCLSFRTEADTTYDIAAHDGRAARAVFHKLREEAASGAIVIPEQISARESPVGYLLWHTARLSLQRRAQDAADGPARAIRAALRQTMEQSWKDRLRWEAGAGDWKNLRLLAMTAIERGKVFARGAYDAETCAPFPPRGLLPVDQARECVRLQLPGGGPDGKAPDGGLTMALQALPGSGGEEGEIPVRAVRPKFFNAPTGVTRNPKRSPLAEMKQMQLLQLEKLRGHASAGQWDAIYSDDCWSEGQSGFMFPTEDGSHAGYRVLAEDVDELLDDDEWNERYHESVKLVCAAWGWDIGAAQSLDEPVEGQTWSRCDVRLANMIRSLWLFDCDDEMRSLQAFARSIKPKGGLQHGRTNLDEVFFMKKSITISAIERPCWIWAFAAARPVDEMRLASNAEHLKHVPALGDMQFRNYLEYLSYFHQTWARFRRLGQILHGPGLHKDRPLGKYELVHAASMLLGGVDSSVAQATVEHIEDKTLFGLVTYIADKEIDLMKRRDSKARQRSARERGNKALETHAQQGARQKEDSRRDAKTKKANLEKTKEEALKAIALEQKKRRFSREAGQAGPQRDSSSVRRAAVGPTTSSETLSPSIGVSVAPGTWCRVKQAVKIHRDAEAAAESVFTELGTSQTAEEMPNASASKAEKLGHIRTSATAILQVGEKIQVLETKSDNSRTQAQFVHFAGGWIVHPNNGSVLVPCGAPRHAASRASSPGSKVSIVGSASAWRPSVSGGREQQAALLRAHHINDPRADQGWSHGPIHHRAKAPSIALPSKEQRVRDRKLAELEQWDDDAVKKWLQRNGLAKLAKPLAEEGFNGRGLAALYRTIHAPDTADVARTAMAAEYVRLFRSRVAQRLMDSTSSNSRSGPMQSLTQATGVLESTWRTFDAALQEQCGEGVVQRLTRDTAQRIQNAHSKVQQEAVAAKVKALEPSTVIGGGGKAATFYREQVKAWLEGELGTGYDANCYHGVLAAFHRAGHEPASWKERLVSLQQKRNGELEEFLRSALNDFVRGASERMRESGDGVQPVHHVQLQPDHVFGVAKKGEEYVAGLGSAGLSREKRLQHQEEQAKMAKEAEDKEEKRRQQWERKERKSRARLEKQRRENEMRARTEYGYNTGFEYPSKSAKTEEAESVEDARDDTSRTGAPSRHRSRARVRSRRDSRKDATGLRRHGWSQQAETQEGEDTSDFMRSDRDLDAHSQTLSLKESPIDHTSLSDLDGSDARARAWLHSSSQIAQQDLHDGVDLHDDT